MRPIQIPSVILDPKPGQGFWAGLRRWFRTGGGRAVLFVLPLLALVLANLLRVAGPAYRSDEIAYLASAAAIAGKVNGLSDSWHGGYSLLLSPFFRLVPNVLEAWPFVVLVNGLAVLVSCLCLWRALVLTGAADQARGFRLVWLGLLVFSTTAYIGWAFTNCVQMALVAAAAMLLAAPALPLGPAAAIGVLLGFAFWVHPTGVLVLIAAAIAASRGSASPRGWLPGATILASGAAMVVLYSWGVHPWILTIQGGGEGHYNQQIGAVIQQVLTMPRATLITLGIGVVNGMATSAIASFGYVGTALAVVLGVTPALPGRSIRSGALRRVLLFLLLSWGFLVLFTSALLPHQPADLQLAFHQRYTQPVLAGLVAFGMALAPRQRRDRWLAWLFSVVPILLALLVSWWRPYNDNFSIIDQLGAVTFFLGKENVPLMLAAGLVTTGVAQLLGWRAFLPVAVVFWVLGWQGMNRIQQYILQGDSRPPAMAIAASTLERSGRHTCLSLAQTPSIQSEHRRLLRYYLSGQPVSFVKPGEAWPGGCDVRIRPVDAESGSCPAVVADSYSREVLEDCRDAGSFGTAGIETLLLPARRDLVSLGEAGLHQPTGFWVGSLHHSDDLPPGGPRDGAWWRMAKNPPFSKEGAKERLLQYGPYVALPAGRYRAVFTGLAIQSGTVEMAVTTDNGKEHLAKTNLAADGGPAVIDFSLERASQAIEVTLRAKAKSRLEMPASLVIYSATRMGSSPWSALRAGS